MAWAREEYELTTKRSIGCPSSALASRKNFSLMMLLRAGSAMDTNMSATGVGVSSRDADASDGQPTAETRTGGLLDGLR